MGKKPQLNFSESVIEIYNRTGIPANTIFLVLSTFVEIVKESLINEVEVVFGDIGYFTWRFSPRKENKEFRCFKTGMKIVKDIPAYNKLCFRQKKSWREKFKNETMKLYPKNDIEKEEKYEFK